MRGGRSGGVEELEANVFALLGRVEAICLVDFGDVFRFGEGDVCALLRSQYSPISFGMEPMLLQGW